MLDNRELAALIWLGAAALAALALVALSGEQARASFAGVIKRIFQPSILLPLIAMLAWISLELWVVLRLALWNLVLAKSTFLWTLGSAGVLFFNCSQVAPDSRFFRRTVVATVGVLVFVEFFMNLYVMSLYAELVMQFVLIVLGLRAALGDTKPEFRPAKEFSEVVMAVIGFALLIYTLWPDLFGLAPARRTGAAA